MVHDSACDVLKLYMSTSYIFNQSWHLCYQITLTLTMESLSQFEILKYTLPTKSHACVTNVINSDNLTHKSVDICNTNTKSGDNLFMCCRIVSETLRKILQVVSPLDPVPQWLPWRAKSSIKTRTRHLIGFIWSELQQIQWKKHLYWFEAGSVLFLFPWVLISPMSVLNMMSLEMEFTQTLARAITLAM